MPRRHLIISGLLVCAFPLLVNADRPAAEEVVPYTASPVPPPQSVAREPVMVEPEQTPEPMMSEPMTERVETIESGDILETPDQLPGGRIAVYELDFPRRGMMMEKVQSQLGRPVEIAPAIGEPPITKWVYNDRVVYFEYSHVVHVVASR